jgi:hypothetical protein
MCFQWSREERTGVFGVPVAHNLVKNLVKSVPDHGRGGAVSHTGIFAASSLFSNRLRLLSRQEFPTNRNEKQQQISNRYEFVSSSDIPSTTSLAPSSLGRLPIRFGFESTHAGLP